MIAHLTSEQEMLDANIGAKPEVTPPTLVAALWRAFNALPQGTRQDRLLRLQNHQMSSAEVPAAVQPCRIDTWPHHLAEGGLGSCDRCHLTGTVRSGEGCWAGMHNGRFQEKHEATQMRLCGFCCGFVNDITFLTMKLDPFTLQYTPEDPMLRWRQDLAGGTTVLVGKGKRVHVGGTLSYNIRLCA